MHNSAIHQLNIYAIHIRTITVAVSSLEQMRWCDLLHYHLHEVEVLNTCCMAVDLFSRRWW